DGVVTPSRHLGLIPAAERRAEAVAAVDRMAELIARSCDLGALLAVARSAPPLTAAPWTPEAGVPDPRPGPVVAVAGGPAFTFGYPEQAELLSAAGAQVVTFDPLRDERLPEGTGAVVIGGGFPEVYAAELSANEPLRAELAAFRGPIVAECAGLLYLGRELDGHPMCGRLGITARMTDRLAIGYRDAVASASVVTREGERYRGHEFHRTVTEPRHAAPPLFRWPGGADGFGGPLIAASYLHLHWAAYPELASRLVAAAAGPGWRGAGTRPRRARACPGAGRPAVRRAWRGGGPSRPAAGGGPPRAPRARRSGRRCGPVRWLRPGWAPPRRGAGAARSPLPPPPPRTRAPCCGGTRAPSTRWPRPRRARWRCRRWPARHPGRRSSRCA